MTDPGEWRRLVPPPRRRPNLLMILTRWRVEVLLTAAVTLFWLYVGALPLELMAVATIVTAACVPPVWSALRTAWQLICVPHRVRAALVQAGVTNRDGKLPWILYSWPVGAETIRIEIGVRAGITAKDVRGAISVIETACGAAQVTVVQRPYRPDRVTLLVVRPRWGSP